VGAFGREFHADLSTVVRHEFSPRLVDRSFAGTDAVAGTVAVAVAVALV